MNIVILGSRYDTVMASQLFLPGTPGISLLTISVVLRTSSKFTYMYYFIPRLQRTTRKEFTMSLVTKKHLTIRLNDVDIIISLAGAVDSFYVSF